MAKAPTRIDLLELDIDLRLADLWREAADVSEWNLEVMAAFMRAAYGKGYCDALTEDDPGSLCHDHGYRIPARRETAPRSVSSSYDPGVARKRNPARLVIALSVAAVLAVFLLYTSIAGGGTPSLSPSELGQQQGVVTLVGVVQPGYRGDEYGDGLRFRLRDRDDKGSRTIMVVYKGSKSDQFRAGREVSVKGELRNGRFVAVKDSLVTKCPSKYTAKKDT